MSAGAFLFDILDESGVVVTTGTNDANGTVRFSAIELTQAGSYTYTVKPAQGVQLADSQQEESYRVEVDVEDAGTGLLATVSYPDGRPTFVVSSMSSSSSAEDTTDIASQMGAAISPTMVAVAVAGGVVLIVAVIAIIWLQSRSKGKPDASAPRGVTSDVVPLEGLKPIDHPVSAQDVSARNTQAVVDVPVMEPSRRAGDAEPGEGGASEGAASAAQTSEEKHS